MEISQHHFQQWFHNKQALCNSLTCNQATLLLSFYCVFENFSFKIFSIEAKCHFICWNSFCVEFAISKNHIVHCGSFLKLESQSADLPKRSKQCKTYQFCPPDEDFKVVEGRKDSSAMLISWHGNTFHTIYEGKPLVTNGFPSQMSSYEDLWEFFHHLSKQADKQSVKSL